MVWAPFGKLRVLEEHVHHDTYRQTERLVETAAVPVARFVKKGSAANSCVIGTDGADVIGVTREGGWLLRTDATETEFSNYAVGDKALVIEECLLPILVETADSSVAENAPVACDANGKATTTTATSDVMVGRAIELVTSRDGTKYIRMYLAKNANDKKVL